MIYAWRDESGYGERIEAEDLDEAREQVREFLRDGEWGQDDADFCGARVEARIYAVGEDGEEGEWLASVAVDLAPEEPGCSDERGHHWSSEGEGGCAENPGVWSLGGTTMSYRSHCTRCGLRRREVQCGSQRNPGEADTVEYTRE